MNKKNYVISILILVMLLLSACSKASEKKIVEAQEKYKELILIHNQVAEHYSTIEDASLDSEIKSLSDKIEQMKEYNLYEMTDDEIDSLISSMDSINDMYSQYLKTIGEIKVSEKEVALEEKRFSLINETNFNYISVTLEEKGEADLVSNALSLGEVFSTGQELAGLCAYYDNDKTPWVMTLTYCDEEGNNKNIKLDLAYEIFLEDNILFNLVENEETGEIIIK